MRRIGIGWLSALALLLATASACSAPSPDASLRAEATPELTPTAALSQPASDRATAYYVVPTISCPSCPARIKRNASKDSGVLNVAVNVGTKRVTVTYDPSKTDPAKIAEAIRAGGDVVEPGSQP